MGIFLNLLYPRKCVLCQRILSRNEESLCHTCRSQIQPRPMGKHKLPHIARWYALWEYQEPVPESIHRFKFRMRQSYAQEYAKLLAEELEALDFPEPDMISWVPISKKRRSSRGYDQAQLLAKSLSEEVDIPWVRTLHKIVNNPPQSTIRGDAQRRANVLGAYRVADADQIKDKKILLLDDVLTTGATAGECARMLLTAGAKEVALVTVAAVPRMK